MTIDEAISHAEEVAENCEEQAKQCDSDDRYERHVMHENATCAADHRQLAEWLTELKQWRRYGISPNFEICHHECKETLVKLKELLKTAVEDFNAIAEVHAAPTPILCPKYGLYLKAIDIREKKWRCADEALALIGEEGDTNG